MKKALVFLSIFLMVILGRIGYAQTSNIPRTISYQGFITDAAQKSLIGVHILTVKLYDAPLAGTLLHTESFSTPIDRGIFSVQIGSQQPLESALDFSKQYWLGISIDEGSELTPRTAFVSVPYALHADASSSLSQGAKGAVLSLNGKSGDIVLQGGAGTQIQTDGKIITISNSLASAVGNMQIQAAPVTSVTGTANQITANPSTGAVVLSLPQNINAGASPTFAGLTLSNFGTGIVHSNGAGTLSSSLISNADIAGGANIAYSKLNLVGNISNSDVAGGASIAYSKLNLVGSISNSDVAGGASIAYSKLNLVGSISNSDVAAGANIAASKINLNNAITSGDIANGTIVNADVNAAANIAYSKLNLVGSISNSDVANNAAISDTKLATISTAGKVANSATTATHNNTASAIVSRDGSGNFSAGTITATLNGNASNVTGIVQETNGGTGASTYTKGDILYASAANTLSKRAIGNTGQVLTINNNGVPVWSALNGVGVTSATGTVNQVLVNGGSGSQITGGITLSLPQDIHNGASPTFLGMTLSSMNTAGIVHNSSAGLLSSSLIVDADVSALAAIADSKLATISTAGKVANSATTATALDSPSTIVLRDASGNFSAGTISAGALNITGKATSASTGNADAATTLATKDYVDNIATEYWNISGNSGLLSSNYIGTSDATNFSLGTNGAVRMVLTSDGSLLLSGTSGAVPASGFGTRMMWIPSLGAFRAGKANGSEWNSGNIGSQSVAMGYGNLASGAQSVAMGFFSSAYGMGSTAMGSGAAAYADGATAFGAASQAVGFNSVAMGDNSTAWSDDAVAIGSNTSATGFASTAFGANTSTTGSNGTVMGKNLTVGLSSFGFNGSTTNTVVDVSTMNNVAYFGDVNVIIGNDDNSARALRFYGSNNTSNLSGAHYSSFKAGTQAANISYVLPLSQGAANSLLTNDGSGNMSWSSLSTLNIPTGSGTANNLTVWNSTTGLGASSNLYYSSNSLGIGNSSPAQALDVTGNANVTGTITAGSTLTANGISMSGGTAVLSYATITAGATISIPNNAVVKITDDGATTANKVTMPAGTNGQIIYIYNNDADTTTGDITLANNTMGVYVYVDAWIKAN